MPTPANRRSSVPSYRKHRASGQAVVTLGGHDVYLGPHGTQVSRREYDRVVLEWLAAGRQWPPRPTPETSLTIAELILRYWEGHVTRHYVQDGRPTSQQLVIRSALRILRQLYGSRPVPEFGPLNLKAVREQVIQQGLSRPSVNRYVDLIRRMFRWGTEEELVPPETYTRLRTVAGLRIGRTTAPEPEPVRPVRDADVDAVLPHVAPPVQAMIQLQRLTGMRPGEVVQLRGADLDQSGEVWVYRPPHHKLSHRDQEREIYFGPQAQEILQAWLRPNATEYLFQPREAEQERNLSRRAQRRTPMTPSQSRRTPRRDRRRPPADHYSVDSYRRAIERGCEQAFGLAEEVARLTQALREASPEDQPAAKDRLRAATAAWRKQHVWSPNQLRHAAATRLRSQFGLDTARTVLGHRTVTTTQIYAEQDRNAAIHAMQLEG
jgi:integrase